MSISTHSRYRKLPKELHVQRHWGLQDRLPIVPYDTCSASTGEEAEMRQDTMEKELVSEIVLLTSGIVVVVTLIVTVSRFCPSLRAAMTAKSTTNGGHDDNAPNRCFGVLVLIVLAGCGIHASMHRVAMPNPALARRSRPEKNRVWYIHIEKLLKSHRLPLTENQPRQGGQLVGDASLVSDCLKSQRLHVRLTGSNVELAGSDVDGDIVTFRGTVDNTGTMLKLNYIVKQQSPWQVSD